MWWWSHKVAMCLIHTYIYVYIMILWWWHVMRTRWLICSTTGSYGRPVIKVVYGETLIHSTETVWEILARKVWLGCRYDASSMFDILGSTPVWAQYIYFLDFKDIKTYIYYVFQIYTYYKRILVDSDLILARWGSENIFDRLWVLKRETKPQTIL